MIHPSSGSFGERKKRDVGGELRDLAGLGVVGVLG